MDGGGNYCTLWRGWAQSTIENNSRNIEHNCSTVSPIYFGGEINKIFEGWLCKANGGPPSKLELDLEIFGVDCVSIHNRLSLCKHFCVSSSCMYSISFKCAFFRLKIWIVEREGRKMNLNKCAYSAENCRICVERWFFLPVACICCWFDTFRLTYIYIEIT